ncbi:MAG: NAD(P)/FAD-dependent oxidoreductase [Pseudomonadales bacterium]
MPDINNRADVETDIAIIGAGPAGAVAAALLRQYDYSVTVLEQSHFPRFSIGESLLPQCMTFVEEAGMLEAVRAELFQHKNGAMFARNGATSGFDFGKKFSAGPATTFQVQRGRFDQILAACAADAGADVRFGHRIDSVEIDAERSSQLVVAVDDSSSYSLRSKFLLDASGFGRVLPRMMGLEAASDFPSRRSVFTHIEDRIDASDYDRDKILIVIHPQRQDVWYWLIPFSNGRSSLGVVASEDFFDGEQDDPKEQLLSAVNASPDLNVLLANAVFDTDVRSIVGYSSNVSSLWGPGFALLGNAGEFLDPVFSSGVTIAMKSASLVAPLIDKQLQGSSVDWEREFSQPLRVGVDTFRAYVEAWYDGSFQDVIFANNQDENIRKMICSILAGYAWDTENPFVAQPQRRLRALAELCRDR